MNEMRGKHTHDGHGGLGGPTTPNDPEHPENADNEKAEQGKRGKHEREAGKTRMASPQTAQEDMVRRTLFTLLKPKKRRNLMKVYAGLFTNNKDPGVQKTSKSAKSTKSVKSAKGLTIPGLPSRDLFLALLHTQCERSARPDNYKSLYSRLLQNKVPLTYIGNKRLRRVLHYLKNRHSRRMGRVESMERSHPDTPSEMVKQSELKGSKKLKNDKGREKQEQQRAQKIHNAGQRSRRAVKESWIRI